MNNGAILKENKTIVKYLDLAKVIKKLRKMKEIEIPIVVAEFGKVP